MILRLLKEDTTKEENQSKKPYNFKDLTGQTFGELTVLEYDEEKSKRTGDTYWKCKCSCGKEVSVSRGSLLNGYTKSCGHLQVQSGLDHQDNLRSNNDLNKKYNTNVKVIANQKMQPNNTSGFKGVDYNKANKKWRARVKIGGKEISKMFKDKEDAIRWRKMAEEEYYQPIIDKAKAEGDLKEDYNDSGNLTEKDNEMSNKYDSEGNRLTEQQAEFFKNSKISLDEDYILESKQDTLNFKNWLDNVSKKANQFRDITEQERKDNVEYLFNWFEKNKRNLKSPENDYYYWINNDNMYDELNRLVADRLNKDTIKQKTKEGAKLIYSNSDWYVYYITNYEASCKYGANTKWCITGTKRWHTDSDGSKTWKEYEDAGIKMYFFIDRKNNEKYALAVYPNTEEIGKLYEIFNEEDLEIPYIPNAPIIKEIGVEYWNKRNDRDLLKLLLMQNKLPEDLIMDTLSEVLLDAIDPFADNDYIVDIMNNKDKIISYIDQEIPDYYIEHEQLSPEEFEEITGFEWEEDWYGDIPILDYEVYADIVNDSSTKKQVLSYANPFIQNNKYWTYIVQDMTSLEGYDSFEDLIRNGIYSNFDKDVTFDKFLDKCVDKILENTKDNTKWDNQLTQLDISEEFLRKGE